MTDCVLRDLLVEAAPTSQSAPVTTRTLNLADGAGWTDVGASPLMMMSRQAVAYAISDGPPEEPPDGDAGFRLEPRVTQTINLASRVWAISASAGGADLVVAGPVK